MTDEIAAQPETDLAMKWRRRAMEVTAQHRARVRHLLHEARVELRRRGEEHDTSKFEEVELVPLAEMQRLVEEEGQAAYGSPEYERRKKLLAPMLTHHYAQNSHHPEHYENGVNGMDLFDLMEMFFDWKAASERGEEVMNLSTACARYNVSQQLYEILANTARRLEYRYE